MTPRDAVCCGLTAISEDDTTHEAADTMLEQLAMRGFVVVPRELLESVLEDAEAWVKAHYIVEYGPHPAMADKFQRDMADIVALYAEMGEKNNG